MGRNDVAEPDLVEGGEEAEERARGIDRSNVVPLAEAIGARETRIEGHVPRGGLRNLGTILVPIAARKGTLDAFDKLLSAHR